MPAPAWTAKFGTKTYFSKDVEPGVWLELFAATSGRIKGWRARLMIEGEQYGAQTGRCYASWEAAAFAADRLVVRWKERTARSST
jgi:hypothetical protein